MTPVEAGFYLMVAGAALVPEARARAAGALAAVAGGLALAGLHAALETAVLDPGFVSAESGLLLLSGLAGLIAAAREWRRGGSLPGYASAIAFVAGSGAMGWRGAGLLTVATSGWTLLAILALSGAGFLLLAAGRASRRGGATTTDGAGLWPLATVAGLILGTVAAAAGPHLAVVFLGAIAAGWAGHLLQRARGGSSVAVSPALTLLLLPAWWLMAAIAGPEGLSVSALGALPVSPAAERLIAPCLLVAGWALAGLWPLHRQLRGALTAPAGALLVGRVALSVVPDGLDHWRPLAMPIVVAGIWHAALTGRRPLLAVGLAWVGLLAPGGDGLLGASVLLIIAVVLELGGSAEGHDRRMDLGLRLAIGVAAGYGSLAVVQAALRGEVVYTALAAGGLIAAIGRASGPQASTASTARTTAPSA